MRHEANVRPCGRDEGLSGPGAPAAGPTRLMMWTAPTLRHQSAKGWLR